MHTSSPARMGVAARTSIPASTPVCITRALGMQLWLSLL